MTVVTESKSVLASHRRWGKESDWAHEGNLGGKGDILWHDFSGKISVSICQIANCRLKMVKFIL